MIRQQFSPGLALAISDILRHRRNGEELYHIQRMSCNLQVVIDYQDLLGWDNFCFGLVRKNITAIQQSFCEDLGHKSLGGVLMSNLERKIWELLLLLTIVEEMVA